MRNSLKAFAGVGALALSGFSAQAAHANVIDLTFEGVCNLCAIGNFYNGGGGGNYGITFGPDSLGVISYTAGGSGNFTNPPSGVTVAFFLSGPGDVMDVAGGFTTGFSFYYADQVGFTGSVTVYDGAGGTGNVLASLSLPSTPNPYNVWVPIGVSFSGTAKSVVFSGAANYIGFDDITLGSKNPGVPEPATWGLMLAGVGLAGGAMRARRKAALA